MDFELRQLETLCCVVEHESFTRAAAKLHLSQAAVSERISSLEQEVGARLLDRLGRKVVPTPVGRRLYQRALELRAVKRDICAEIEGLLGTEQGALTIGASTIPGEYILPAFIASFRSRSPDVFLRVVISDSQDIATRVAENEIELGVVGSEIPHPELTFHELCSDELVLVVPADHPWSGSPRRSAGELCGQPFVIREPGSGTRRAMERSFAAAGLDHTGLLDVGVELGSTTAVKEAVIQGLGVSILSARAVEKEVSSGLLCMLQIEGVDLSRSFYLARNMRRTGSPLCDRFTQHLLAP